LIYFLYIFEYGLLKPVEVILRRKRGKKGNNGRDGGNVAKKTTYD
jgi:hypothetical protein